MPAVVAPTRVISCSLGQECTNACKSPECMAKRVWQSCSEFAYACSDMQPSEFISTLVSEWNRARQSNEVVCLIPASHTGTSSEIRRIPPPNPSSGKPSMQCTVYNSLDEAVFVLSEQIILEMLAQHRDECMPLIYDSMEYLRTAPKELF